MEDTHYVYLITRDDGKKYVGVTKDLHKRMLEHYKGRGNKDLFNREFSYIILDQGTRIDMYNKECKYIEEHTATLNIAKGGFGGNGSCGSNHWNSRLTEDQVLEIKKILIIDAKRTYKSISVDYGVTVGTIEQIASNKTWKHLGPEIPSRIFELDEKTVQLVMGMWEAGATNDEIGLKLNISRSKIARVTNKKPRPLKTVRGRVSDAIGAEITRLRVDEGLSYSQISDIINIAEHIVGEFCRSNNLVQNKKAVGKSRTKISPAVVNKIIDEYVKVPRLSHVSNILGISVPTIKKYLKLHGVI